MIRRGTIAALLVFCCGLAACGPGLKHSEGNRTTAAPVADPAALAKQAMESERSDVRMAAVAKLSDQMILADVFIKGLFLDARLAALEKLSDPAAMARAAIRYDFGNYGKISTEDKIAVSGARRELVRRKLADPAALVEVAANSCEDSIRQEALEKLTNQKDLVTVAINAHYNETRLAAVDRITDPSALEAVINEARIDMINAGWKHNARDAALEKLSDPEVLAKLALKGPDEPVRLSALEKIVDPAILMRVALESRSETARTRAAARMTGEYKKRFEAAEFEYLQNCVDKDRIEEFIRRYPDGPFTSRAKSRLVEVAYANALASGGCREVVDVLVQFPEGPGAADLRSRLAAKGRWEKAQELGIAASAMTLKVYSGKETQQGLKFQRDPSWQKRQLERLRILLAAGADPTAVRIDPSGRAVPESKPGSTLEEYFKAYDIREGLRLLREVPAPSGAPR